jgi:dTDP-4-dehydrorhamnose 3,5-epimerase
LLKIIKTKLEGVVIIKTIQFKDQRGWFTEGFNKKIFKFLKIKNFVQDNISFNKKIYTFRGMHLQSKPFQQSKLIRVDQGAILDFVLDLRLNSKTYLQMIIIQLDDQSNKQIFIPKGLAHGFLTLKPNTKVFYKVDQYYSKKHDQGFNILDPKIKIAGFNKAIFILSAKDKNLPLLNDKY